MPRMPQPPECDCHFPVSASEDVKLKILETKLQEQLDNKQEKLVAGENITIIGNVISSIGGGILKNDLTTNIAVGGVPAGTLFEAGTKLEDILTQMLYTQAKVLQNIAITTAPTKVNYVAGEVFSTAGMVVMGYYSDGTSEVVTGYAYYPTGALAVTDTKITVSYTYNGVTKTAEQAITVVAPSSDIEFYRGIVDTIPTSITGLTKVTASKADLLASGYLFKNITTNNQFAVLAMPKSAGLNCYDIQVAGFSMGFTVKDLGDYYLYHFENPTSETSARYTYLFEEE